MMRPARSDGAIRVYDCRVAEQQVSPKLLQRSGVDLNGFLRLVREEFAVSLREQFVLVTTDRTVVDYNKFKELPDGSTLYLLQDRGQELPTSTKEDINFVPHFNTLTESGAYEYFCEGQKALPCSLAELVDNALNATAKNTGIKTIEIRLLFDRTIGKPAVLVIDNGCGMTSKKLNNWAVYRLSKFERENSIFKSEDQGYVCPAPVRRSLNSEINFFGVGGKRAVFHIGDSVRMISKPAGLPDVHELVLSKEEFRKKEENKEDVYKGTILSRKPGDSKHITDVDERFLFPIIKEEVGKESFTAVVITGVCPAHIDYLKEGFNEWTRELAHIYHYYIHGVDGNNMRSGQKTSKNELKIDIVVTLQEKPAKPPCVMNLREVMDDMQTLYINSAVDTFEFRATTSDGGTVEGILRYHPFLYDKETYPRDPFSALAPVEQEDSENEADATNQARGKRDIFECFWNGRLIPYTTVSEFEWCRAKGSTATIPPECYYRFSGALFTDDKFGVNASKLKFMDLEIKLKQKNTIFTPVHDNQKSSKRGNIQREFTQWLQACNEKYDKQVQFLGYISTITREDVPTKKMQHPWAIYTSIELDGKTYKQGQLVKTQKTQPILYGTVIRFLLYGNYNEDTFANGGQVEIRREPEALYDKITKIVPITKIDRTAPLTNIRKFIETESEKLPEKLDLDWPEGNAVTQNAVFPCGTSIGPIKVEIVNGKGFSISSRIHTGGQGIKLYVLLKVVLHGPKREEEVVDLTAPYTNHGHWFKRIDTLTRLGKYTLTLNAAIKDNGLCKIVYGGKQLPNCELKFSIKEGKAETFSVGSINSPLRVGVPFSIPLQINDGYGHPTTPPPKLQPVLICSGLELSYETTVCSGCTLNIKGVRAIGKVQQTKSYDLNVTLPGLQNDTQTIKINLSPGNAHTLIVKPDAHMVKVENGNPASFMVEVHDEAGNVTSNPKQIVCCQVPELPMVVADCSSTGVAQLITKPVKVKIINGEPQILQVRLNMPSQKRVLPVTVELKVMPSNQVARMELFCQGKEKLLLRNQDKIEWQAGGLLENLFYKLFDESGGEVPITARIAANIKVNWTSAVDRGGLLRGKLPDVQVPTKTQEERFYQVSYQDQSVSSCFTIMPCPDEVTCLKATLTQSTAKLGEILPGEIKLELFDQYGNATKRLTSDCMSDVTVEAEGLDKSNMSIIWQEKSGSALLTGLRFCSGSLGPREVCFSYRDFKDRGIVKVTAGLPSQLKLVSGPKQPMQVLNGHGIHTAFLVQLCDEWGNPSPDQRVVVEIRSSPHTLKVSSSVLSQPVDAEGKALFTIHSVTGPKGYYQLDFRACYNSKPIPGPSVIVAVIPDPNRAVKLQVDYNRPASFPAGDNFPVFLVTVVSEEGSAVVNISPADLSMLLWDGTSVKPPCYATVLKCSKPLEGENKNCFYFRDKKIPEKVGKHTIQFSLSLDKSGPLLSNQININVVPNRPVKLGPDVQPPTPVVSNSADMASRLLAENMNLRIMDMFGNPTGQELSGKVVVTIGCPEGEASRCLPLFQGKSSSIQMVLKEGRACVERLAIMENSPGENGTKYVLIFSANVPMLLTELAPFELPFHFYNDAENQQKMTELTRRKDELISRQKKHKDSCDIYNKLGASLRIQLMDRSSKEVALRREMKVDRPLTIAEVSSMLQQMKAQAESLRQTSRRVYSVPDMTGLEILGKVGHLAVIEDSDVARVISWHMQGDLDCVITYTTAAARKINNDCRGNQQVMALDSIFVQQGDRPLPHIRNGRNIFDPPGNPVLARTLLMYTREDKQSCEKVFKNLLGDTILMDDLTSATDYRQAVVGRRMPCPTILTRGGDRISARGKFGGRQNHAPDIQFLKTFGAPYPPSYFVLNKQIEILLQYHEAVVKKDKAEKEHKDHTNCLPRIQKHEQQIQHINEELEEIDRQLAVESARLGKRRTASAADHSGALAKRPRKNTI